MYRIVPILSLLTLLALPLASDAFGHGIGADEAPPISFEGMDVTVRTELTPYDLTAGEPTDANIQIRFYDTLTNMSLNEVTYFVQIYRSDDLLARNLFYDVDGTMDIEVRPVMGCSADKLWKCTKYHGTTHTISGGLYAQGESRPIIKGPIFDKGGLYNIKVNITGASSPKTLVAETLGFETFVSVAQEQDFIIQTAQAEEVPITVKTYYDDITKLEYSPQNDSITFEMPFDWDPEYISLVQVIHEEIRLPKSFEPYPDGTSFKGYVNGVEVDDRVLIMDPYTYEDHNILHFLVGGSELERINGILGPENHDSNKMAFQVVPHTKIVKNSAEFDLVDLDTGEKKDYAASISWDSSYGANEEIPFEFAFFDEDGKPLKDVKYAYYVTDGSENVIRSAGDDPDNLGIDASEGIDVQKITIPSQEVYRIDVYLIKQGLDFDPGTGTTFIEVGPQSGTVGTTVQQTLEEYNDIQIPQWVKSNAALWSDGVIDDLVFVGGIEYLIKEGTITVSEASSPGDDDGDSHPADTRSVQIPQWVKSNAALWSDGVIDDRTFAGAIEWLIANGIIVV